MERAQRIVSAAFIFRNGRVLMAKRSSKANIFPNQYELPGGKIEFGEEPREALKREIMEELGVRIRVIEPFHVYNYIVYDGKAHYIEIVFLVELLDDESRIELKEHEDIKWVNRNELESITMSDETKRAVQRGFEYLEEKSI